MIFNRTLITEGYSESMDPFALIIFGVTGNLSQKKLIPSLYALEADGLLHEETKIIGVARRPMSDEDLVSFMLKSLTDHGLSHNIVIKPEVFYSLSKKLHYIQSDFEKPNDQIKSFGEIKRFLDKINLKVKNHLFYFATYPDLYPSILKSIKSSELDINKMGWVRLMIEKPIGHDLQSAVKLNKLFKKYFKENQIFRLDHYLGKETIQNILVFRFGNGILSPVMNKDFVDHIQITATEDFGIGSRGGYYDTVGALRDVGQNHLLQMLVVATMEAPSEFNNLQVTQKRIDILESLVANPKKIVFGQYNGYLFEENVSKDSTTDTFFAFKTEIDNDKWKGVPIYIRGGKKMTRSTAEISIVFKTVNNPLFGPEELSSKPNVLTYRIQPNEGIGLELLTKRPDHKFILERNYMQFCYNQKEVPLSDAYEKLLYDAIAGDGTFFNDSPEVESSWKFIDSLVPKPRIPFVYEPGSWGPKEADDLIEADGRKWIEPSEALCLV